MSESRARITVVLESPEGGTLSLDAIASRIGSLDELGAKVGEAVQREIEKLATTGYGKVARAAQARVAELEKLLEALKPKPAPVAEQPAPPVEEKTSRGRGRRSDG